MRVCSGFASELKSSEEESAAENFFQTYCTYKNKKGLNLLSIITGSYINKQESQYKIIFNEIVAYNEKKVKPLINLSKDIDDSIQKWTPEVVKGDGNCLITSTFYLALLANGAEVIERLKGNLKENLKDNLVQNNNEEITLERLLADAQKEIDDKNLFATIVTLIRTNVLGLADDGEDIGDEQIYKLQKLFNVGIKTLVDGNRNYFSEWFGKDKNNITINHSMKHFFLQKRIMTLRTKLIMRKILMPYLTTLIKRIVIVKMMMK